jgi:hypothetical protein
MAVPRWQPVACWESPVMGYGLCVHGPHPITPAKPRRGGDCIVGCFEEMLAGPMDGDVIAILVGLDGASGFMFLGFSLEKNPRSIETSFRQPTMMSCFSQALAGAADHLRNPFVIDPSIPRNFGRSRVKKAPSVAGRPSRAIAPSRF